MKSKHKKVLVCTVLHSLLGIRTRNQCCKAWLSSLLFMRAQPRAPRPPIVNVLHNLPRQMRTCHDRSPPHKKKHAKQTQQSNKKSMPPRRRGLGREKRRRRWKHLVRRLLMRNALGLFAEALRRAALRATLRMLWRRGLRPGGEVGGREQKLHECWTQKKGRDAAADPPALVVLFCIIRHKNSQR